jgi:hypothetical protein
VICGTYNFSKETQKGRKDVGMLTKEQKEEYL